MTGGMAVILGRTGGNFGAGMSGGMAFVLDLDGHFEARANSETIVLRRIGTAWWEGRLRSLIEAHVKMTDSRWAASILEDWPSYVGKFWQVVPREMLTRLEQPLEELEPIAAE
jgi:glutamate synthase (NADPH/NADH) large chain